MNRWCTAVCVALLTGWALAMPVYASVGDNVLLVEAIGGFFSSLFDTIFNAVDFLLSGLKWLFIPDSRFFPDMQQSLFNAFEKKFGGILSLAQHLKDGFSNLKAYRGDIFVIQFPRDHFFGGARVDFMSGAGDGINMIRGALSGSVVLFTVAFAYKKVVAMINT